MPSLTSLNSFLLANFAQPSRTGTDIKSLIRRHQTLSIIYINVASFLMLIIFEVIMRTVFKLPDRVPFTVILMPFAVICFIFLRKGKNDLAAAVLLGYIHLINHIVANHGRVPLAGLYALMLFPVFAFFLTSSNLIRAINSVLSMVECISHSMTINEIFNVTMNEEQTRQMLGLYVASFLSVGFICALLLIHKSVENSIWDLAQSDFQNIQNLTKEAVQAVEAKDKFVSSLSHEIRNPLNSLNGSIEYLLEVVKDVPYLRILKNAKLSSEILLNIVNNTLDVAKLRSDKMEISYMEAELYNIIQKVLLINSENLREAKISVEAFLDQSLPRVLWIDPSRILQILMNLVSNAIKFTPSEGRIRIHVAWCSSYSTKESLLVPIDDYSLKFHFLKETGENPSFPSAPLEISRIQSLSLIEHSAPLYEEFTFTESKNRLKNPKLVPNFQAKSLRTLKTMGSLTSERVESDSECWTIHIVPLKSTAPEPSVQSRHLELVNTGILHKGYLKIQVADTGCGIAENNVPKLFQMFGQAHEAASPVQGGTGLGLWICRQLCQKMGGEITLYSQVNEGTTFIFYIPVDNAPVRGQMLERCSLQPVADEKIHALVVDDYSFNRDLHKLILENEGVSVTVACNGKEAVERYKESGAQPFDLILMDIQMPEMDGFTAAKLIREFEESTNRKKADIYFVSGEYYNEEEVMAGFRKKGKMGETTGIRCLRKPIDIAIVKTILKRYTRKEEEKDPKKYA